MKFAEASYGVEHTPVTITSTIINNRISEVSVYARDILFNVLLSCEVWKQTTIESHLYLQFAYIGTHIIYTENRTNISLLHFIALRCVYRARCFCLFFKNIVWHNIHQQRRINNFSVRRHWRKSTFHIVRLQESLYRIYFLCNLHIRKMSSVSQVWNTMYYLRLFCVYVLTYIIYT